MKYTNMKKCVLVICLILVYGGSAGAGVIGEVEAGYDVWSGYWFAEIEAGYEWGWLWLWGGIETYMAYRNNEYKFRPVSTRYYIGGELRWRGMYVGLEHQCIHPVLSDGPPVEIYDEGTKISVGYRWGERR